MGSKLRKKFIIPHRELPILNQIILLGQCNALLLREWRWSRGPDRSNKRMSWELGAATETQLSWAELSWLTEEEDYCLTEKISRSCGQDRLAEPDHSKKSIAPHCITRKKRLSSTSKVSWRRPTEKTSKISMHLSYKHDYLSLELALVLKPSQNKKGRKIF